MSAVREKKYLDSPETSVILTSESSFRSIRAQVTPEIPLPMMTMCLDLIMDCKLGEKIPKWFRLFVQIPIVIQMGNLCRRLNLNFGIQIQKVNQRTFFVKISLEPRKN